MRDGAAGDGTAVPRGRVYSEGRVRDHNEDAFSCSDELGLFIVCDGMGGHSDGEVASLLAVQTILERINAIGEVSELRAAALELHAAMVEANNRVFAAGRPSVDQPSMGTTAVALWLRADNAVIAHVGDSRCYRLRGAVLEQITQDHTFVEEARAQGTLELLEPALAARYAHVLTRSVGQTLDTEPDLALLPVEPGDRFLLCSDGLSEEVDDDRIAAILRDADGPGVAAARLVAAANEQGGHDSITAVVVWPAEARP